ncbi:hypothetical protein ACNKHM_22290 [Shigella sonnei]
MIDENNSASGYDDWRRRQRGALCISVIVWLNLTLPPIKTLVIGNTSNDGAIDSLAGTGVIGKRGGERLVLNADNNGLPAR